MKFSEAWLREYVNPELTTQELVDQLTMAGLEVDGFEPVAADFSNVVVGENFIRSFLCSLLPGGCLSALPVYLNCCKNLRSLSR